MVVQVLVKTFGPAMGFRSFRYYWFGTLASVIGFQILAFSQFWIIHELTGSALYLGYVGVANAITAMALNLFGGVLADKVEKKRLITITQTVNILLILILVFLIFTNIVEAWHVIFLAFLTGSVNAFDLPARIALYPTLIAKSALMNAVALNTSIWTGTNIIAPAIAGLIISNAGTISAFILSGIGFLIMVIFVQFLPANSARNSTSSHLSDLSEGINFIFKNKIFALLIGMSFFISFFGLSYIPMMPIFSEEILEIGVGGQGSLMAVAGIGALLTTLILARIGNFPHKGMVIVSGAFLFGILLISFTLTSLFFKNYFIAIMLMFLIGLSHTSFGIPVISSLQLMVPDHFRGRVMGMFGLTWSFMPLGGLYVGFLSGFFGDPSQGVSLVIAFGGLMIVLFTIGVTILNRNILEIGKRSDHIESNKNV